MKRNDNLHGIKANWILEEFQKREETLLHDCLLKILKHMELLLMISFLSKRISI